MLLAQAWERISDKPGYRFQVFVQYPQNWSVKGWIAVFQHDGTPECEARIQDKADRFIGVYDSSAKRQDFFSDCSFACLQYRFKDKPVSCPIVDTRAAIGDSKAPGWLL
jgi:hypothetical protein